MKTLTFLLLLAPLIFQGCVNMDSHTASNRADFDTWYNAGHCRVGCDK